MIVAKLNRDKLRLLAGSRLNEARVLLENQCWTGAYYMTGLALECALKAHLSCAVQQYDFPDKNFVNQAYTHNLKELARLDAAFWAQLQRQVRSDEKLESNWNTVQLWNNEDRYEMVEALDAKSLYAAATEPDSGIMDWIRRRW